ncbi:MAG: Long-chain-fatty-acid--CoA ligase FadD13 [Acidimicrobiales bacterium]|nr:MAG: acyl-CoA synthetase [Actinomycetota bacterium]MBV6507828.1 Long-chain-fatty-acid--CoA ligase FadD13 [Acidimicrobiales bacterium]RIK05981.1 MAG: acyl-CoA synthetase [Acidobacteriota bacterium]
MELGFWRNAEADPDRVALVTADGAEHTAGRLLSRANQLVHGLRAQGMKPGDTLAVVQPNAPEMIEIYLAALQAGWYLTPINHHLVGPEIAYIVDDSDARVFIGHERFAGECAAAQEEFDLSAGACFAVGEVPGFQPFADLWEGQATSTPEGRTAGMAMHYTSGTTGRPKGVKRGLIDIDPSDLGALLTGFQGMFGITPGGENVHICGSPLYHTAVLMWCGSALHMGHKVVLMDKWDAVRMMELIDEHRVTWSHMVPTQFHRILTAIPPAERDKYDVSSLRSMVHAAAPCPPGIKREMIDWWGDSIWEYYAATEGGGTIISAAEWLDKPGSVGKAWPGSDVKILDDEHHEVPTGTEGTVYMSLAQANFEYKGDRKKTADNRYDGYFTVGDWGLLDEDGYLFLKDRKSDMIISGGVNIYPAEIEAELIYVPGVADVAVFGIPHEDWGEEVKAVVLPAEGHEPGDELREEIMAYAEERLAKYKRPRTIDFIEEMPRDPNGKLYKRKLRDPYWEGRDRNI